MNELVEDSIPPIFGRNELYKLTPGQPIYEYYLSRRVDSDIEYLQTFSDEADLAEQFRMIAIEYVLLSEVPEDVVHMKIEELKRLIEKLGIWGIVEEIKNELKTKS